VHIALRDAHGLLGKRPLFCNLDFHGAKIHDPPEDRQAMTLLRSPKPARTLDDETDPDHIFAPVMPNLSARAQVPLA
jgi:hypothetical protein